MVKQKEKTEEFIDPIVRNKQELSVSDTYDVIPMQHYGKIAMELAMGFLTPAQIADEYGISINTLNKIIAVPEFQAEKTRVERRLSDDKLSGFANRAAIVAEASLPILFDFIKNPAHDTKYRLKATEMVVNYAGYAPQKTTEIGNKSTVNVQIGAGIRGLTDGTFS